jgi:hypothetical protein
VANKDFVVKNSLIVGDTATINGVQIDLSNATSGQVLKFDGSKFAPVTLSDGPVSISYEETIGNNSSTSFTITHNLGTKDLNVIVRENTNPYDVVEVAWEATTTNIVTLNFELAPTTSSKRVIIKGPGAKEFYSTLIGDGSSSTIVINHGLGSRNVVPVLKNAESPFEVVDVLSSATSLNSVTFDFSDPPESESLIASVYLLDLDNSYISTIGDGTNNQFTITHNLNTRDIGIICRSVVSPYDFTSVRWEATTVNTAKVIFSSPPTTNSRKIGIYKALGGSKFINDEVTLEMLDDVSITSASNGQFLSWNGTNWVNSNAPGGASINSLDDIPGVTAPSPSNGDLIQWNGTAWVNVAASTVGATNLDGLSDVVVTSPLQFQGLMYDGTNWVNSNIPDVYLVRNNTGSTIPKGTLVGAVGAEPSGRIDVAPFQITGTENSELRAMGIATSNISSGVNGEVMSFGTLTGLDTRGSTASALAVGDETWAAGDILFAHPTVDGKLTNVRPQHDLAVAFITVRHASTGQIAIRIIPGNNHLEWMHDVSLVDKTSGDFLKYNGTLWVNDAINLGTDTVGDYISSLVAGTGITLANNSGEGATPTITVNTSVIAALASPTLTGTPTAPTANAATNTTQIATTAFVRAEVAALVNSAGSTLDTLGEIATALGNDANLSTTLTTSIGLKAPLASPTFTGTVTIPEGASISGFAPLANATFTGTVTLPSDTSIGNVSATEIGYVDGVTSAIQTQLNTKASTGKAIAMAIVFGG